MSLSPWWSLDWVRAVQGWGDGLLVPMQTISFFGSPGFFIFLIALCYWCIDKRAGRDLALLMIISGYSNTLLKALTHYPRPFWLDPSLGRAFEESYSLPSGHAQNATVLFGYLAWRLTWGGERADTHVVGRIVAATGLILLIPLVAVSRVYLGVHYPGDVLVGALVGFIILALYLRLSPAVGSWLSDRSFGVHLALAIGVAALSLLSIWAALRLPSLVSDPQWDAIGRAAIMQGAAAFAGMIAGGWPGFVLEARHVHFSAGGLVGRRALRFAFGVTGMSLLSLVISALPVLPPDAKIILQGGVVAFWVAFLWPWLFVRIGL